MRPAMFARLPVRFQIRVRSQSALRLRSACLAGGWARGNEIACRIWRLCLHQNDRVEDGTERRESRLALALVRSGRTPARGPTAWERPIALCVIVDFVFHADLPSY